MTLTHFSHRRVVFVCLMAFFLPLCAFSQKISSKAEAAILSTMARQEKNWNEGSLEGFMHGYWQNDSLKFVGSSGVTYGWDATLARYQKGYPDKTAMGKLTFTILHVEGIGKKAALVVGKWHLQREKDAPNGHFSLVWRKIKGEWVIVADHSS